MQSQPRTAPLSNDTNSSNTQGQPPTNLEFLWRRDLLLRCLLVWIATPKPTGIAIPAANTIRISTSIAVKAVSTTTTTNRRWLAKR